MRGLVPDLRLVVTISLLLVAALARGDLLSDPMRPPHHEPAAQIVDRPVASVLDEPIIIKPPPPPPLVVQAIEIAPLRRSAVINGRRVRVGDRLGAAEITSIEPHGVMIDEQGQRRLLRWLRHSIKQNISVTP
jgi:hypothetical protein